LQFRVHQQKILKKLKIKNLKRKKGQLGGDISGGENGGAQHPWRRMATKHHRKRTRHPPGRLGGITSSQATYLLFPDLGLRNYHFCPWKVHQGM
jgi:hypothetical protein